MKISIGKLANIFGLTKEGLRFYERNNMIEPSRDDVNGYRSYSGIDVQKVAVIKKMKNLGFSLEETRELMSPIDLKSYREHHIDRLEELKKEHKLRAVMIEKLEFQQEVLGNLESIKDKPEIVELEEFYHLDFLSIEQLIQGKELADEVSTLFRHMHIVSASSIIPKEAIEGESVQCHKGLIVSKSDAELLGLTVTEHMKELPMNQCVKVISTANIKTNLPYLQMLPSANKYIEDHGLTVIGDGFTRVITSYVNTDSEGEIISELYIPIR